MDYFFYMIGIFLWHLFYKIIYPWYLFIGVAHKSDMQDVYLLRNYGLTGFEALWQFPLAVLTSLSGLGWLIYAEYQSNANVTLISAIIFFLTIFIVATFADTRILSKISEMNRRNPMKKSYHKTFLMVYMFWRMLLPDFFVVGALIGKLTNITYSPKQLFRINLVVQGIRLVLFLIMALWFYVVQST